MFLAHNNNNDDDRLPLSSSSPHTFGSPSSQGASAFYDSITRPKEGGKRGRKKEVEKRSSEYVVHGIQGAAITDRMKKSLKNVNTLLCFRKGDILESSACSNLGFGGLFPRGADYPYPTCNGCWLMLAEGGRDGRGYDELGVVPWGTRERGEGGDDAINNNGDDNSNRDGSFLAIRGSRRENRSYFGEQDLLANKSGSS